MKGLLSLCKVPLLKNIFVVNRQCTYIYCIIDFLYCSNCNPLFILSCFFHICNITSCCTFSCVRVTNKILLLTSGRITVITDDDMFLTWQLLDSYTSYNLISIVFQMCKNYVFNIVLTITNATGKTFPSSDKNGFQISAPTSYVMTYILPPAQTHWETNKQQTNNYKTKPGQPFVWCDMYIQCLYICSKTLNQVKQVYKNRSTDSCIFNGYQFIELLFQPTDSYIRVRPTWYRLTQQFIPECTDTYPQHGWKCPKNNTD